MSDETGPLTCEAGDSIVSLSCHALWKMNKTSCHVYFYPFNYQLIVYYRGDEIYESETLKLYSSTKDFNNWEY